VTARPRRLARIAAALAAGATLLAVTGCTQQGDGSTSHAASATATSTAPLRTIAAKAGLRVGVAVNTDQLADSAEYAKLVGQQFSTVTPENVMKWDATEPKLGTYDWTAADQLVAYAQQHDQLVRGHNLVWYQQLPAWLTAAAPSMSADQLRQVLKDHITAEVTHFKGKIWQWDVVNEAFDDTGQLRDDIFLEKLGPGYIADAFRWAHAADPDAKLFLNDYGIEDAGMKSTAELQFVQDLKSQGVPIDGVGFETHVDSTYAEPDLETELMRFAQAGFDVAVTEADVRAQTPIDADQVKTQSGIFADTVSACLDVPQCISYTIWGLDDKDSWVPSTFPGTGGATLYDEDLKPKPQFAAVQKALARGVATAKKRVK